MQKYIFFEYGTRWVDDAYLLQQMGMDNFLERGC